MILVSASRIHVGWVEHGETQQEPRDRWVSLRSTQPPRGRTDDQGPQARLPPTRKRTATSTHGSRFYLKQDTRAQSHWETKLGWAGNRDESSHAGKRRHEFPNRSTRPLWSRMTFVSNFRQSGVSMQPFTEELYRKATGEPSNTKFVSSWQWEISIPNRTGWEVSESFFRTERQC
jgi:hypothetical protein